MAPIRKPLSAQSKEILFHLNNYFKEANEKDKSSVVTSTQLVSTSTGIPLSCVKRVLREGKLCLQQGAELKFRSPKKTKCRERAVAIGDWEKAVIRRIIYEGAPTMNVLYGKVKSEINYPGSTWALRKEVSLLGFRWKKIDNKHSSLVEKHEIRYLRINFLIKIADYRALGRPIVYTDETYIDSFQTATKSHSERLIIIHAGGSDGFIPYSLKMFKAKEAKGDFRQNIDNESYTQWLKSQLIPNLKPNSVVVVGNAPYHNMLINPVPNSNSRKQEMIDWLHFRNIVHSTSMLKPQLYQLIMQHRDRFTEYKLDNFLREHNHSVVRLPPCHPDFNPLTNMYATIKAYIDQCGSMTIENIMRLVMERTFAITGAEWINVCEHSINEEKRLDGCDADIDAVTEGIKNTGETSEESEEQDDDDVSMSN